MGCIFPKRRAALARDYLDVTRLIRSIQRGEGNNDCFRRNMDDCQENDCCWRPYCIEERRVSGSAEGNGGIRGPAERFRPEKRV